MTKPRLCNPSPPDYPDCSKDQVTSIAHDNDRDWFLHRRFGQANILQAAGLTNNQIDTVKSASRAEVRDNLQDRRRRPWRQAAVA